MIQKHTNTPRIRTQIPSYFVYCRRKKNVVCKRRKQKKILRYTHRLAMFASKFLSKTLCFKLFRSRLCVCEWVFSTLSFNTKSARITLINIECAQILFHCFVLFCFFVPSSSFSLDRILDRFVHYLQNMILKNLRNWKKNIIHSFIHWINVTVNLIQFHCALFHSNLASACV